MLKLTAAQTTTLLAEPETGMGYQLIEATLRNNKTERGIAYNAELVFLGNETQTTLRMYPYTAVLKLAQSYDNEIKALRVLPRETSGMRSASVKTVGTGSAKDAPKEKTTAGEVFKRFSASPTDNRLKPDGSWRDGTYATTEEDAKKVKTGKEAVARYALPNPEPASYVYTGRPHEDTEIQKGTVQEAFGQPGGGVEVFFPNGTQPNTVTGPETIPND